MRRVTVISICGLALASAPAAHAAGGPVPPAQGGAGVSAPGGGDNFITVSAGLDRTVVMRVRRSDASVQRSRSLNGSFGIPGVTYDGINTGLSADGGTLVLSAGMSRYPPKSTKLRVLDPRSLKTLKGIELKGMVTVDAISPDGRWLYLVDYKNGGIAQYDVRAYDLRRNRLLKRPVIDPREPEEKLQGFPVTRVQSDEGRWAYTLYSGEHPFIHALDTEGRTAVCIDMPQAVDNEAVHMTLEGDTLTVAGASPIANVDLKSFKVTTPAAQVQAPAATVTPRPAAQTDSSPPWALWLIPPAAFAALAVVARQRRARHSATSARAASGHSG